MKELGLYYPYIHVQDEEWLKAAALYWPSLGRLVPHDYSLQDSPTAQTLRDELNFFVDIDPSRYANSLSKSFLMFVEDHEEALCRLYAVPVNAMSSDFKPGSDPRLAWIHVRHKMLLSAANHLQNVGLAVLASGERPLDVLVGMHPRLGWVYLAALADTVAQANNMAAVTDQPHVHGTLNGWTFHTLAKVLLDANFGDELFHTAASDADEVTRLYGSIAISTVIPKGLRHVPVKRIVRARQVLQHEFDAFREYLDSLNEQFTELAKIESPEVLHARLQLLVDRDIRRRTADLERGLRQLGLEPARAVLGMKSLELPAAVTAAVAGAGLPIAVGQAGLVAAQLVASTVRAGETAQKKRRGAVGYLLGLREELDPIGVVDRVHKTLRRISIPRTRKRI